ncbi:MAG: glycine/sarcosine/betaine reductase complex component subunit beta [Acidimicrobiaceae bacterium]|jgi:betaine reductase|nr:glycine/sarcosine/betaine reductase complex component subunit beta [Acidimicrobiaceae bacterium]MDQ1368145.1 glycine/sarcosine/betaine reductase complex component subunit beta [Acidimicrobiaceae bacterium]MDQ1412400.1 glycine/sarcosine/betaine reductase complex component subunit beta [Acidimicrobiaceae bacterium]MDQ1442861.1 glycine/sarcosine/betaine reductase complex component subunit beta [Acidimicrobiaceae bacterium]
MPDVVISAASQVLAHVPLLARHGSKPRRELPKDPGVAAAFAAALRPFPQALAYPANQAYINALHPRDLPPRPWGDLPEATRWSRTGEIMPEEEFLGLLAAMDDFDLLTLSSDAAAHAAAALARHPLAKRLDLEKVERAQGDVDAVASEAGALEVIAHRGAFRCGQVGDEALSAHVLIDNLAAKATATLALLHLLEHNGIDPTSVDYVLGCGEEAIGDRYQRGGGNMAKAVAEAAGLTEASGADIKNFCAAPVPALVIAASLVSAGVFQRVAVVGGGCMAKLGMKFQGHLKSGMPILEDVLGGAAALVQADDGVSPRIRLDGVGRHKVAAGGSNPQVMEALAVEPLTRLGLAMTDVDDYATELHNPEVTEPQGSGNVPERNYRTIAALAARKGDIAKDQIAAFVTERGMPGYSPTQGHLASSLCYLPHAVDRLTTGGANRVMLIAKGSLFLGRVCQLSDGMSVLLERNGRLSE